MARQTEDMRSLVICMLKRALSYRNLFLRA